MSQTRSRDRLATDAERLTAIEQLLLKYPRVRPDEADSIARFLRKGPVLDIGLLSANREAWAQADAFRRDYPHKFATTPREYAAMALAALTLLLAGVALWHATAGR
ncbi:hypothetical protein [Sphingomonas flavescens]|uniref:hypothetical protein n=1 Tax=Sphingomonas flavescens TaxID=3132797 RepID=UPI0028043B6E|nr:hypothetical protein [Sphingomonas limnosediminicola]